MKRAAVSASLTAMLIMMTQPCFAAEDIRLSHNSERRSAVFAGANVIIPLGRPASKAPRAPRASLQLTTIHTYRDTGTASPQGSYRNPGLEMALSRTSAPGFLVGGQNAEEIERRLELNGDTTTWVIVGGIAVILIVVVGLASSGGCLGPSMEKDC